MTNAEKIAAGLAAVPKVRERCAAVPEGLSVEHRGKTAEDAHLVIEDADGRVLCDTYNAASRIIEYESDGDEHDTWTNVLEGGQGLAVMKMFAASRTDLPLLCDALEAAQAEIERLRAVADDVLRVTSRYHEQMKHQGYIDTPAGLEHMGDVWTLLLKWESRLKLDAALPAPAATEKLAAQSGKEGK